MTHSTVRLWDQFRPLATEDIPADAIKDTGDTIEITLTEPRSPIREAVYQAPAKSGFLPNMHITIDADPGHRRGGLIREIRFHAGTLVLLIAVHSRTRWAKPETIYPPNGYGIGLPGTGNSDHAIIGCWATEDEARAAIADLRIVALGDARPGWDQR